jgi:hypothetical protein
VVSLDRLFDTGAGEPEIIHSTQKKNPVKTKTREITLRASNQKTNKKYSRLRRLWNMFRFRFAAGRGKPELAQKVLYRIPLPESGTNKAHFWAEEKKSWKKYVDQEGNLRLVTWKNVFGSLVKAIIGAAIVIAFVWGAYSLTTTFITLKAKSVYPFQPDTSTGKELHLINDDSIVVDLSHQPLFFNKRLYLPVLILKEGRSTLFYIPDTQFSGEWVALGDGSTARTFFLNDGKTLSYLYNPKGKDTNGTWLDDSQLTALKTAQESRRLFVFEKGEAKELRSEPKESAKSLFKIPGGERFIFLGFAPISSIVSKFVWVEVRYLSGPGNDHQGWMTALSIERPFVEVSSDPGSNILKIINNSLSFREAPSTDAAQIPEIQRFKRGETAAFLKFASLADILSSQYVWIQVSYNHSTGEVYTGWLAAGKIKETFIHTMDMSKKE